MLFSALKHSLLKRGDSLTGVEIIIAPIEVSYELVHEMIGISE